METQDVIKTTQELLAMQSQGQTLPTILTTEQLMRLKERPPLELEKKPGLGYIAAETLKGAGRDVWDFITGVGEAGMAAASGVPSYIAGVGGQALKTIFDLWKTGAREIAYPQDIIAAIGRAEPVKEKIAEIGTYKPATKTGEAFARIPFAPFEAAFAGVDEIAKLTTDDPEIQRGIRFLADTALILGLPLAKNLIKTKTAKPSALSKTELRSVLDEIETKWGREEKAKGFFDEMERVVERIPEEAPVPATAAPGPPEIPKAPPAAPKVEAEIRVSKDATTGETVIRVVEPTAEVPRPPLKRGEEALRKMGLREEVPPFAPEVPRPEVREVPGEIALKLRKRLEKKPGRTKYPFIPKDAPQIWFDVLDATSGKGIRPHRDLATGKFFELEEYKRYVPRQLRNRRGLPADEVADMLGYKSESEFLEALEYKKIQKEIPERYLEAEDLRIRKEPQAQKPIIDAEADILRRTGESEKNISEFIRNDFMDGEKLREVAREVTEGKRTIDDAVIEIKDLIESTVKPVEVEPPSVRAEARRIAARMPEITPEEAAEASAVAKRELKRREAKEKEKPPVIEPEITETRKFIDENIWDVFDKKNIDRRIRADIYERTLRTFNPKEQLDKTPLQNLEASVEGQRRFYTPEGELRVSAERLKKRPVTDLRETGKEKPVAAERIKTPEEAFVEKEINEKIRSHIHKISKDEKVRKILTDRILEEKTFEEIARELGISKQAVNKIFKQNKKSIEVFEVYSGYPFSKEIKASVERLLDRFKEKKAVQMEDLKTELQKTDKGKVEWMYLETERLLNEKNKPSFRAAYEGAKRALADTSGNIKKKLLGELGSLGKEAVIDHDLIAGASQKAEMRYTTAEKTIYSGLNKEQEILLNRAIQSRRTIAISKYRKAKVPETIEEFKLTPLEEAPPIKHPFGLTEKEHTAWLKDVPKEISERADLYFKEMENVLDILLEEGLIDKKQHTNLKAKGNYSPRWFIQHIDPEITYKVGGKTITVPGSGLKALDEGSFNVMETNSRTLLSSVIARTQSRVFRNRANKSLYEIADKFPDNKIVWKAKEGETVPAGHTKLKVMIEGKAREMIMPDELAKEWLTRDPLINEQLANLAGWISGSKILKPMATGLNPEFALTNFPRDIGHVWITTSEYSSFLPKQVFQTAKDLVATAKDAFTRKGRWIDYIEEGGGMAFLTHQGRILRKISPALKKIEEVLGYVGETSEIWTRLALRERAIRNGKSPKEATWIARNYLDFSQGGNVTKALDTGLPYLNAGVQATRGIFRAFADRPVQTMWKFAQLGTLASGLFLANRFVNKECWDSIPDREKVNNFIITTPFKIKDKAGNERHLYFKIAKDQGQRIFSTIFENLMAKSIGDTVDGDQIAQAVQDFLPIIPGQDLPPSLDALLGYVANKDFWTNEDIWKGAEVTPREEYTNYTHPALVKAGEITGLSPKRLENALSQIFTRGNIYTSLVSGGLNLLIRDLPKADRDKTTTEIVKDLPFARRVFKVTPPYDEREIQASEKAKVEENTRRLKQRRTLDNMASRYYKKLTEDKVRDPALLKEIKTYIYSQPKEDRQRLITRFKNQKFTYNIPDRTWWINLVEMPPETRATVFWTKYAKSNDKDKKELIALAKKIPGLWSERFSLRFRMLVNKLKEE